VRFAAVPTWGTTPEDRAALAALPNVTILEPTEQVDRLYARTRVLLMPSLWQEAFGVTAVEAMLRGLPVLVSDVGGLPEAALGAGTVLPVRPIEYYEERHDANEIPAAAVPEQDLGPWKGALTALLSDSEEYTRRSAAAREAASRFVGRLGVGPFEELLGRLPRRLPAPEAPEPAAAPAALGGVDALTPEQRALLMLRMRKKAAQRSAEEGKPAVPAIPRAPRDESGRIPLSFAQQRLWFLDQVQPGNPVYNIPASVSLRGRLDPLALEGAFREVLRRHESLRTAFGEEGGRPFQVISSTVSFRMPEVDLRALPAAARAGEALRLREEHGRQPFDLARGPLLVATLVRLADEDCMALVNMHHIASDGWSVPLLIQEISALYAALHERRAPALPELPIQYADFAVWQRGWLQGEELERQLAYWRERLSGDPPVLELPADRPRPAVQTFRGGRRTVWPVPGAGPEVRAFSQRQGLTPFMTTLAAFKAVLGRLTGQTDITVGTPIAARNRQEIEPLIGFFVNTLVLRTDLAGDPSFRELAGRVRETTLGAFAHQDVPFEEIVKALGTGRDLSRDLSRNPLFQVMFALHNTQEADAVPLPGVEMRMLDALIGTAKFDFDMMLGETPRGIGGSAEFNSDLFDVPTVDRLIRHWQTLIVAALTSPDRPLSALPLLEEGERHQLLVEWNDSAVGFPGEATLPGLFEARAAAGPDNPAVLSGNLRLTYAELAQRSAALAGHLRAWGVHSGDRVAISLGRTPGMVVGLLAIARAGAAYVPLDPSYPAARRDLMLQDAQVKALITDPSLAETFASGIPILPVDPIGEPQGPSPLGGGGLGTGGGQEGGVCLHHTPPDLPAYVIYTSGSTGTPKGVMVDHRGRVNNFLDFNRRFGIGPADRLLAVSSLSFDMTAYDVFGTLAAGGAIVLPPAEDPLDPARWAARIREHGVTVWHSAPALLEMLVGHLEAAGDPGPLPLRLVLLGGDWIPLTLPDRLRRLAPGARVVSLGGATEVSMDSTIYEVGEVDPAWKSIPYGVPMWNQSAWVVDPPGNPAPIGVPGELLLGGAGVGHGYFGRPDLTADRFIPDALSGEPGARLYRTGDLARFRTGGWLELLGRLDFQVKVRGVRIELGEIVAALERHEAVREAVVAAKRGPEGPPRLVAYVVPREGREREADPARLADFLRARLPEPMVPSAWMTLEKLPLTPNGKVDRRALPDPEPGAGLAGSGTPYVEPSTALERVVAGIWRDFLPVEQIGACDNFFALGGHSLLATQVVSRLRTLLPVEVPLRTMLERPTVAGLAAAIDAMGRAEAIDMDEVAKTILLLNEMSEEDVQRMLAERAETAEEIEEINAEV
jgi:amino acid adenylation domain-containing protein